jgi:hypothetical protein
MASLFEMLRKLVATWKRSLARMAFRSLWLKQLKRDGLEPIFDLNSRGSFIALRTELGYDCWVDV